MTFTFQIKREAHARQRRTPNRRRSDGGRHAFFFFFRRTRRPAPPSPRAAARAGARARGSSRGSTRHRSQRRDDGGAAGKELRGEGINRKEDRRRSLAQPSQPQPKKKLTPGPARCPRQPAARRGEAPSLGRAAPEGEIRLLGDAARCAVWG